MKPVVIKLDTWEKFDAWMDRLSAKPAHTPQDLVDTARAMGLMPGANENAPMLDDGDPHLVTP